MTGSNQSNWVGDKKTFPIGTVVEGRVEMVHEFGAFVSIPGACFPGIIVITSLSDSSRALSVEDFPQVGTAVRAVVVGHRDLNRQIALSLRESDFQRFSSQPGE